MQFSCPKCKAVLDAADSSAGQKFRCGVCGQHLIVPAPPAPLKPDEELSPTAKWVTTLVIISIVAAIFLFGVPEGRRFRPASVSFATFWIVLVWWKYKGGENSLFVFCTAIGTSVFVLAVSELIFAALNESDITNLFNQLPVGDFAKYLSTLYLGATLAIRGFRRTIVNEALPQYIIMLLGIVCLWLGYFLEKDPLVMQVFSYGLFFLIGAWAPIDTYVMGTEKKLSKWKVGSIIALDAAVLGFLTYLVATLYPPMFSLSFWVIGFWLEVAVKAFMAIGLWVYAVESLCKYLPVAGSKPLQ
jgi:hypothetical protein